MKSADERLKSKHKLLSIFIAAFLVILLKTPLTGQEEKEPKIAEDIISIGVVAGTSMNSFNFNGMSFGVSGGAYFKFAFSPAFHLQPEIKYSILGGVRRNAFVDYSNLGGNVNSVELFNRNVQLHSVEFPVLLRIAPEQFRTDRFTPRILFGGFIAYAFELTEHQDKLFNFSDGSRVYTSGLLEDVSDYYEQLNYGFIVGFGIEFTGGSNPFGIDLRYRQAVNQASLVGFVPEHYAGSIRISSITIDFTFGIFN